MPKCHARPRLLGEPAAWRAVARAIRESGTVYKGVCLEAYLLVKLGRITDETWGKMLRRATDGVYSMEQPVEGFAFPPGTHPAERAMIADLMALEAAEEEREARVHAGRDGANL